MLDESSTRMGDLLGSPRVAPLLLNTYKKKIMLYEAFWQEK